MVWLKRDSLVLPQVSPALEHASDQAAAALQYPVPRVEEQDEEGTGRRTPVVGRIRQLIEQGRYPPGSHLPSERALAVEFGIGRPALREAIKALSVLGMVESRRGSGTLVKSAEPVPVTTFGTSALTACGCGTMELLEVRRIIEPRAAWLSATRANEAQMLEMQNARVRLELHDRDWKLATRLDFELHVAIFQGAHNPALELLYRLLMSPVLSKPTERVRFAPDVLRIRRDHRAIVEAILRRQAREAEKAMTEHLQSAGVDYITDSSR
jgi:GntR family transcriptional repressor for pyruvate dehydrogenase complex